MKKIKENGYSKYSKILITVELRVNGSSLYVLSASSMLNNFYNLKKDGVGAGAPLGSELGAVGRHLPFYGFVANDDEHSQKHQGGTTYGNDDHQP